MDLDLDLDLDHELGELAGLIDSLAHRVGDGGPDPSAGAPVGTEENRVVRSVRARRAVADATRLQAELIRLADRTRAVTAAHAGRPDAGHGGRAGPAGPPGRGDAAERREGHLVGQATGVLMERHHVRADAALECLLATAREERVDTRTAALRVIASIQDPQAPPVLAPLDVVLRRIPRSLVTVRPAALLLTATADRPLVQLRYDVDDPNSATGAAAFVALRGPAPAAGPSTYELVDPQAPLLEEPELFTPFPAGRGLRWIRAQDRRTRLLWGDAESIVDAVTDRATAARAATHLGCPLVEPGAPAS